MSTKRTWIRAGIAALLVVTCSLIPVRARAQEHASPRNAEVDARGARSVHIEAHAGSLRVEGRTGLSQVRIRGTARASARNMLGAIKLVAERRGDVVFVKADIPDQHGDFWDAIGGNSRYRGLDLVIEVPVSLPLEVADGSGEATFVNTGALSLADGSGEIEIRMARGNVRVNDGSGAIDIDGVEGSVRIDDGSGEIKARNVTGDVSVDTDGSGNISVAGVGGTMRVGNDGSGSIDVDRVGGNFVVSSDGGGSIRYATVKGTVDIPDQKKDRRRR